MKAKRATPAARVQSPRVVICQAHRDCAAKNILRDPRAGGLEAAQLRCERLHAHLLQVREEMLALELRQYLGISFKRIHYQAMQQNKGVSGGKSFEIIHTAGAEARAAPQRPAPEGRACRAPLPRARLRG